MSVNPDMVPIIGQHILSPHFNYVTHVIFQNVGKELAIQI